MHNVSCANKKKKKIKNDKSEISYPYHSILTKLSIRFHQNYIEDKLDPQVEQRCIAA